MRRPHRNAMPGSAVGKRRRWLVSTFGPAATIVAVQQVLFPSTGSDGSYQWGLVVQGVTLGLLSALVALGMALIYRANRILNFAQGDLGLVPVSFAVALVLFSNANYFVAFGLGLVAAVAVGAVVELAIIRRFFASPRLILTVATIGLAQLLAFVALALPRLWGEEPVQSRLEIPFTWRAELSPFIFDADYIVAWVIPPIAMVLVALFLRFSSVGIAMRASADRVDRASLLGIPVGMIHTYVWIIACVLSFLALFLRAGVSGLPLAVPTAGGLSVGLTVLLSALAALMLGSLTNLPGVAASAVALGLLEVNASWNDVLIVGPFRLDVGSDTAVSAVLAVVIVVALLVRRTGVTRSESDDTSSWETADAVRPVPRELRHLPEVRLARLVVLSAVAALLVAIPHLPAIGDPGNTAKATGVVIFAIVIMSVTVLTGWAGQVSLGQMGFVAIGAALGAKSAIDWDLDLAVALPLIGLVGAGVAVLVGLPALRLRGLYLAVVTLAFALATTRYLLNPSYFEWVPRGRFEPKPLLGAWDYAAGNGQEGIYYLSLGVFLLLLIALLGVRRSRTGRVLVALRENPRGVQVFGVSLVRAKLAAFALSGFVASVAGVLLVHLVESYSMGLVPEADNLTVFTAAVVGGLGSMTGAVLGALFLKGGDWFLTAEWRFLASALGVLLVLLVLPGGLGGALFRGRDLLLRQVARRRGIVVPSLLADTRELEETAGEAFEARAAAMAATHGAPS